MKRNREGRFFQRQGTWRPPSWMLDGRVLGCECSSPSHEASSLEAFLVTSWALGGRAFGCECSSRRHETFLKAFFGESLDLWYSGHISRFGKHFQSKEEKHFLFVVQWPGCSFYPQSKSMEYTTEVPTRSERLWPDLCSVFGCLRMAGSPQHRCCKLRA
jgi:hypothetical protein